MGRVRVRGQGWNFSTVLLVGSFFCVGGLTSDLIGPLSMPSHPSPSVALPCDCLVLYGLAIVLPCDCLASSSVCLVFIFSCACLVFLSCNLSCLVLFCPLLSCLVLSCVLSCLFFLSHLVLVFVLTCLVLSCLRLALSGRQVGNHLQARAQYAGTQDGR